MNAKYEPRNTSIKAVLDVCQHDVSWLSPNPPATNFLCRIATLGPGFTVLDVMAAAHATGVLPPLSLIEHRETQPPRFVATLLDMGLYTVDPDTFEALETGLRQPRIQPFYVEDVGSVERMELRPVDEGLGQYDCRGHFFAKRVGGKYYDPKPRNATKWLSFPKL
ncbi:hypothetical protein FRC09_000651 [Ceratobasidium sp. 395]|nr:hypothetical protein FRC09_000651 [Ceratobasidium sp. 395]